MFVVRKVHPPLLALFDMSSCAKTFREDLLIGCVSGAASLSVKVLAMIQ